MRARGTLIGALAVIAGLGWAGNPIPVKQPAKGPMAKLQRLAEHQGHPSAAVKQLKNFGDEVTPEMEAAALGIKPEDVKAAVRRGGSLESRLEAVLRRPLSADQKRQIADAGRNLVQDLGPPRNEYVQNVARATGLSAAQVGQLVPATSGQDPKPDAASLAEIERLLGRRLTARELEQIQTADQARQAAAKLQQGTFAREVARITGIPQKFVLQLLP